MPTDPTALLAPILALHDRIRDSVVEACAAQEAEALASVAGDEGGDTIYAIDRVGEAVLVAGLEEIAASEPLFLVAEGLSDGGVRLPRDGSRGPARWRLLVDPIDGTRGIMYQKRSAWILTGVAPDRGADTRLSDIVLAVQTEIPLVKQHLSDQLWAVRGEGASARRFNRLTGESEPLHLRPSRADTIAHGYSAISRFFPGARADLAAIDDELVHELLGPAEAGRAACFEDQYASTAGQLYELMAGHDRFLADLRPLMQPLLQDRGKPRLICCHPYDVSTLLIAEEMGVEVTGLDGKPLDAPFDLEWEVGWAGYANAALRARVEPALRRVLGRRGLLPPSSPGL